MHTASDKLAALNARSTGPVYFILEGEQPMDGEFYHTAEQVQRALIHAEPDAKVFAMFLDEGTVRDVTDDVANDAFRAGWFDGHPEEAATWGLV